MAVEEVLHRFGRAIDSNELPGKLNNPFQYDPHPLCEEAWRNMQQFSAMSDPAVSAEADKGKMFGVLIVADTDGSIGYLCAFSGQIADSFHLPGFVPPIFDYLPENGYFKTEERNICALTNDIEEFSKYRLPSLKEQLAAMQESAENILSKKREAMAEAKKERDLRRESGECGDGELAAMIKESQFMKAELARCRKRLRDEMAPLGEEVRLAEQQLKELKQQRRQRSENLQRWLFDHYMLTNGNGDTKSLFEVFVSNNEDHYSPLPPSGTGECCAPKLLEYAFRHHLKPLAIAEYWHGKRHEREVRHHGASYPACRGKCGLILPWMLQGLDVMPFESRELDLEPVILAETEWFCIVDKPSGLLSVPGNGNAPSVYSKLVERYGAARDVRMVHRLDRDTSGLMIVAFGAENHRVFQRMFATHRIHKTYGALLEGDFRAKGLPRKGVIRLPLRADIDDRPRQVVDFENGEFAETEYEFTGSDARVHGNGTATSEQGYSQVLFKPATGRTHQLRVHASSPSGLGLPIVGDPLYGRTSSPDMRLHLHATTLSFTFRNQLYTYHSPIPF